MALSSNEIYKIKVGDLYFTIKKTVSMAYSQTDTVDDFLKIGGDDMCVEYKYNKINPAHVELQWLHTDGQKCVEGDMKISGENTLFLFYLSIQILKLYTPVTHIEFLDNSKFPCKLPNGKSEKIHLSHCYFLFHGKTWYHAKFGAYPLDAGQRIQYDSFLKNFDNSDMKPPTFDFKNNDLNAMFLPIWNTTNTWREFIHRIHATPNICQKVYPWYYNAALLLTKKLDIPAMWCIDVQRLKFKNIPFERISKTTGDRVRMKTYIQEKNGKDCPIPSLCNELKYR